MRVWTSIAFFIVGFWASVGGMSCSSSTPAPDCKDKLGCVELKNAEPLKLGVIQALSGKIATLGQEQIRGLELALERRGGKVAGRSVALQTEDTGCKPEGGANAALRIVSDTQTVAIFGTTCSGDAATAAEVMSAAGLSMISGNNSAPFLTSVAGKRAPKWSAGFLRTAPNEESAGPAAAKFAFEKLGVRAAAVIDDGDIYTKGLTEGFQKEFVRLGGKVVLSATVNKNDTDMAPVLTAVLQAKPELVFFPLFQPEGNLLLLQARKTPGFERIALMSDGSLIDQSFIQAVGQAAQGMYFVGPAPPAASPEMDKLVAAYKAKYQTSPATIYYMSAYDATEILFAAIEKVAFKTKDGGLRIGRQALRDALYSTAGHAGVTGRLSCNEFGDCAPPRFNVLRLDDPTAGVEGLKNNIIYAYAPGS